MIYIIKNAGLPAYNCIIYGLRYASNIQSVYNAMLGEYKNQFSYALHDYSEWFGKKTTTYKTCLQIINNIFKGIEAKNRYITEYGVGTSNPYQTVDLKYWYDLYTKKIRNNDNFSASFPSYVGAMTRTGQQYPTYQDGVYGSYFFSAWGTQDTSIFSTKLPKDTVGHYIPQAIEYGYNNPGSPYDPYYGYKPPK